MWGWGASSPILSTPDRARARFVSYVLSVYIDVCEMALSGMEAKADTNYRMHGVRFDEAADVFYDPDRVELFDEGHSEEEGRYVVIGFSVQGRLLFVSFKPVDNLIRIIHARVAERKWRKFYEENN